MTVPRVGPLACRINAKMHHFSEFAVAMPPPTPLLPRPRDNDSDYMFLVRLCGYVCRWERGQKHPLNLSSDTT